MATLPVVNIADKRKGIIASFVILLLLLIYLLLTTFEMADPPPKDIPVKAQAVIDELVLKNLKVEGGSGGGTPSDAPIAEPLPQTEKVLTKKENPKTKVSTGQSNQTNANNAQNQASTTQQSTDPFSLGGSGGGTGGGSGNTFGHDAGTGSGGGTGGGSGKGRAVLNHVNPDNLSSNVHATIRLKLTVDAEGNVVAADIVKAQTTTSDQILINKVREAVKKQVKYNKDPGSPLVQVIYTVNVEAR